MEFKAQNYCSYLGDFNGDGITDVAFIRCLAPYVSFKDEDKSVSPALFVCFFDRKSSNGPQSNEKCIKVAKEFG
jgi:hypothetical protein